MTIEDERRPDETTNAALKEAVRLLTVCDHERRKQTRRGLGEFGASAAEIDFRRGLDGMIADFLAAHTPDKKTTDAPR